MDSLFERLKQYLSSNSEQKILDDWSKTVEFDKVGPSIDDFILNLDTLYEPDILGYYNLDQSSELNVDYKSPEVSPGFFI